MKLRFSSGAYQELEQTLLQLISELKQSSQYY